MNFLPQGPLFEPARSEAMLYFGKLEQERRIATYLCASLIAIPVGLLPWMISKSIVALINGQISMANLNLFGPGSLDGLFLLSFFPLALGFIIYSTIHADRRYEQHLRLVRSKLAEASLALLILDDDYARALRERQTHSLMPELFDTQPGGGIRERADYFGHYHRHYLLSLDASAQAPVRMLVRQNTGMNLAISALTGLLAYLLVGLLIIPFACSRLFHFWPAVSASRMAYAEYLNQQQDDS